MSKKMISAILALVLAVIAAVSLAVQTAQPLVDGDPTTNPNYGVVIQQGMEAADDIADAVEHLQSVRDELKKEEQANDKQADEAPKTEPEKAEGEAQTEGSQADAGFGGTGMTLEQVAAAAVAD